MERTWYTQCSIIHIIVNYSVLVINMLLATRRCRAMKLGEVIETYNTDDTNMYINNSVNRVVLIKQ